MAELKALLPTIIHVLFLISHFHIPNASSKPAGFSLKLIRTYFPMSSPSHKNNTFLERYKSNVQASKVRASYWTLFNKSTANKTIKPDVIEPPLIKEGDDSVVVMSIGTPVQQAFLLFDTGSWHSWTQCASCTTCFPQSTAKFNPIKSTTYREMSPDDPNCKPPIFYIKNDKRCEYKSKYIAGQYSNGIGSYDSFGDTNPFRSVVDNVRFGCSLEASRFAFPPNTIISGILGMSRSEDSFPRQFRGGKGQFSYCLVDINKRPSLVNLVTFGDDIPYIPEQRLSVVPFMKHRSVHAWAINIFDITVGNERLYLPPGTFAPHPNGGNGALILDSGSRFTFITRNAYLGIRSMIINHLSKSKDFTRISSEYDLCYRYNGTPGRLPKDYLQTITFHLDNNAHFEMPVTSVYFFHGDDNTFCLGILEAQSDWPNILGSRQQQDTRFVYDLNEDSLFISPEICAN